MDPWVPVGGLLVGIVVGLTGMGGGALMTPMLVLVFGVAPLTAVATDLVASAVMKLFGGAVHWKSGSVHRPLATWLILGSVPAAFGATILLYRIGSGTSLDRWVRLGLGGALVLVALTLVLKTYLARRSARLDSATPGEMPKVRPLLTLAVGIFGGAVVGLTSVGSGSLMMLLLLIIYPRVRLAQLVGTDLVQAVPLVFVAGATHALVGQVSYPLAGSLLIGAIPGALIGARLASRASDRILRPILACVLLMTGLKLLGAPTLAIVALLTIALLFGLSVLGFRVRRRLPRRAL